MFQVEVTYGSERKIFNDLEGAKKILLPGSIIRVVDKYPKTEKQSPERDKKNIGVSGPYKVHMNVTTENGKTFLNVKEASIRDESEYKLMIENNSEILQKICEISKRLKQVITLITSEKYIIYCLENCEKIISNQQFVGKEYIKEILELKKNGRISL